MTKFTFTSPDGQKYDVNGPDGATQDQAFAILQQQLGQSQPADSDKPPQPQEGSGVGKNIAAGLNEGAYKSLTIPFDLAAGAQNLVTRGINKVAGTNIPEAVPASTLLGRAAGAVNPDWNPENVKAATPSERYSRMGAEGASMMLVPEGVVGAISKYAPGIGKWLTDNVVGQTAGAADRARNVVTGVSSGIGSQAAQDAVPDQWKPVAGIVGGAAGGVAGATASAVVPRVIKAGVDTARSAIDPLTQAGQERIAANRLRDAATDPYAVSDSLENGPTTLVPGSEPTTFQQTGDMGLGQLERQARTQYPDQFLDRAADQNAARVAATNNVQAEGAPEQVASTVRKRLDQLQEMADQVNEQAVNRQRNVAIGLGGSVQPETAGSVLRDSLEHSRASAKANERSLWDAVDPDGSLTISPQNAVKKAGSIADSLPETAAPIAGEEKAIHNSLSGFGDMVPFSSYLALRARLNAAMKAERIANGESPAYARMKQLRGAVQSDLTDAVVGQAENKQSDVEKVLSGWRQQDEARARGVAPARDESVPNTGLGSSPGIGSAGANGTAQEGFRPPVDDTGVSGGLPEGGLPQVTAGSTAPTRVYIGDRGSASGPAASSEEVGVPAGSGGAGTAEGAVAGDQRAAPGIGLSAGGSGAAGTAVADQAGIDAIDRLKAANAATIKRGSTFDNRTLAPIRARPGTTYPYNMRDSAVAQNIFAPGPKGFETVQAYRKAVSDPEAMDALQGYAVDRLRQMALKPDGTLDPARVATFRRQYGDALRAFPELDRRFADAATATQTMGEAAVRSRQILDDAQTGVVGKVMGLDAPEDVERTIGGIFSRQDGIQQMSKLRSAVAGNPDGEEGLRKAVANWISKKFVGNTEAATSGVSNMKSDAFQTFMKQNAQTLKAAGFSDEQISTMQAIAQDLQRSNRSIASSKLPGQSNTVQDLNGVKDSSILNKIMSSTFAKYGAAVVGHMAGGTVGMFGAPIFVAMRDAGLDNVNKIIADAMLDPNKARLLLSKASTPAQEQALSQQLGMLYRRSAAANGIQSMPRQYLDTQTGQPVPQEHIDAAHARLNAVPDAAVRFLHGKSNDPAVVRQFEEKYGVPAAAVLGR